MSDVAGRNRHENEHCDGCMYTLVETLWTEYRPHKNVLPMHEHHHQVPRCDKQFNAQNEAGYTKFVFRSEIITGSSPKHNQPVNDPRIGMAEHKKANEGWFIERYSDVS